jgi:hypothetical protein
MKSRWIIATMLIGGVFGLMSCAAGSDPSDGDGDDGGDGGDGGAGGAGGEAGAGGGGGSGPNLCGNGVIDQGESCDGFNFGNKTCQSLGLGGGSLLCNGFCKIVATQCTPLEQCSDTQDNDNDFLVDCQDSDCTMEPTCIDSCTPPKGALVGYQFGDTTGRPDVNSASCAPGSGPETIYEITAPATGDMIFQLSTGVDMSLSLRTACGDEATEIACVNAEGPGGFETLNVPVTQGMKYFVLIDGTGPTEYSWFDLYIDMVPPESDCYNSYDDDFDGMLDCDDPTACQGQAACAPGPSPTGAQCSVPSDCFANANDPICLPDFNGWPNNYCSEFCNLQAPDCSGDAICADMGISQNGVCLDGCLADADCRPGYACVDKGLSSKVCMIGPETQCADFMDNDFDGLFDCEDPDKCQGSPECASGPVATGGPCSKSNQCTSLQNDPLCLDEFNFGYPQGYCSQFCDLAANDCGSGATCIDWFGFQSGHGTCFDNCAGQSDCRPGYLCDDFGFGQAVCIW